MSTAYILVRGRNFCVLLDRLKNRGVSVYEITEKAQNEWVVKVKYRDCQKVFAICKNMWYNELIGYGGPKGILEFLRSRIAPIVCAVLFTILAFFTDGYLADIVVEGAKESEKAKIFALLEKEGISAPCKFSEIDLKGIEKKIYKTFDGVDFVTVKKSGNRLIIDLILGKTFVEKSEVYRKIAAKRSGVVLRLAAYSGTPLKKVGDKVVAFETLIDGYYLTAEDEMIEVECRGSYDLKCSFEKEIAMDVDLGEDLAFSVALLEEGVDLSQVLSKEVKKEKIKDKTVYTVKIDYLFTEGLEFG